MEPNEPIVEPIVESIKLNKFKVNYSVYDIIDYLDPNYIDYLDKLPDGLWKLSKKLIIQKLHIQHEHKIIEYLIAKLKLTNVLTNFFKLHKKKISIEYFKYIYSNFTNEFDMHLMKSYGNFVKIFNEILLETNFEFNLFVSKIFLKQCYVYPMTFCIGKIFNKIAVLNSYFYRRQTVNMTADYNTFFQYVQFVNYNEPCKNITNEIKNIRMNELQMFGRKKNIENTKDAKKIKKVRLFNQFYKWFKNISFEQTKELANYFKMSKELMQLQIKTCTESTDNIIYTFCKNYDIEYFIRMIEEYDIINMFMRDDNNIDVRSVVAKLLAIVARSKNIDTVRIFHNYLQFHFGILFNEKLYLRVCTNITFFKHYNFTEYKQIMYELVKLSGNKLAMYRLNNLNKF